MARIVFETEIAASALAIVDALTTQTGIKGWWTDDATLDDGVGSTMTLGFAMAPKPFELRIEAAEAGRVRWRSTGDFPPHWADTAITWTLSSGDAGGTKVHFNHDGWSSYEGPFAMSAYTWAQLLGRLTDFAEAGTVAPLFVRGA